MRHPTPRDRRHGPHGRQSSRSLARRRLSAMGTMVPGLPGLVMWCARTAGSLVTRARRGGGHWFWLVAPVLAIALAGSAQAGRSPVATYALHNAPGRQGSQLRPLSRQSGSTQQVLSWTDPTDQTALTIRLGNFGQGEFTYSAAVFTFTLPDRSTVTVQDADSNRIVLISGLLNNLGSPDIADPSGVYCGFGQFQSPDGVNQPNGTVIPAGIAAIPPISAVIQLQVGQGGLVGYAGLDYPASTDGFTNCPSSSKPNWEVIAGCTVGGCTQPLPPTVAASNYGTDFTAAVRSGDWGTVYTLNSTLIRGQYSTSQFATRMKGDAGQFGAITSISDPVTPPVIQFLPDGQAYFVATQNVTYTLGGKTRAREVASYFLLEGGIWHFWFSV